MFSLAKGVAKALDLPSEGQLHGDYPYPDDHFGRCFSTGFLNYAYNRHRNIRNDQYFAERAYYLTLLEGCYISEQIPQAE